MASGRSDEIRPGSPIPLCDKLEECNTGFATSNDGTRIAFDRLGAGPPVIVVAGLLCDRETLRPPPGGFPRA